MLVALARTLHRRRWPVLGAWLLLTLAGLLAAGPVFDRAGDEDPLRPDAESRLAAHRVDQLVPEGPVLVAVVRDRDPYDPALVASVQRTVAAVRATAGVVGVHDLYDPGGSQIGADNRSTLVRVELSRGLPEPDRRRAEDRVVELLHRIDAPQVLVGGETLAKRAFTDQAVRDAARGETVALGVLLLLLLLTLGPVRGLVPLAAAVGTVATTLLALFALGRVTQLGQFTVNVVTLLGTGLAVDYALLLVAGLREELEATPAADRAELAGRTLRTAGRTVLAAGSAVAAGMAALLLFGQPLLTGMALGGAVVALVATLAGLTLVPALLAVCPVRAGRPRWAGRFRRLPRAVPGPLRGLPRAVPGPLRRLRRVMSGPLRRLSRAVRGALRRPRRVIPGPLRGLRRVVPGPLRGLHPAEPGPPPAASRPGVRAVPLVRMARYAQRRPVAVLVGVGGSLLLLALPFLSGARLVDSDVRALPADVEARRAYEIIERDFDADRAPPVVVVVAADPADAAVRDLMNRIIRSPQVLRVQGRPDVPAGSTIVDVTPRGGPAGTPSREVVDAVRRLPAPVPVLVGGPVAELMDYQDSVRTRLPLALLALILAAGVPLFLLTGSVVIPVKGVAMTALTLLATLGLLVLVFQHGVGASLLGVRAGPVDVTTPVLLLVFVVGLSTDYEAFLLERIGREWRRSSAAPDRTATDRTATDRTATDRTATDRTATDRTAT
ncbi:MMPL family transporter, partial [Plantactinospora siamensis]